MVMTPLIQPTPLTMDPTIKSTADPTFVEAISRRINELYCNDIALAGNIDNVANTAAIIAPMATSEADTKIAGAVQSAAGAANKVDRLELRLAKIEERMLAIEQLLHAIANPKEGSW